MKELSICRSLSTATKDLAVICSIPAVLVGDGYNFFDDSVAVGKEASKPVAPRAQVIPLPFHFKRHLISVHVYL